MGDRRVVVLAAALAAWLVLSPGPARAERRGEGEPEWLLFAPVSALVRLAPSADPDEPSLRLGILGLRRHAMAGARLLVVGVRTPRMSVALELSGFVALENFTERSVMPWELVRAGMALGTIWHSHWLDRRVLPRGGRLILELGFAHESDHAASVEAYRSAFLASPWAVFDNGNFSSHEHLRLRLRYQQSWLDERLELLGAVGGRYYTPSINPGDGRALRWALSGEVRLSFRLVSRLCAFLGVFFEAIGNDFVASDHGFAGDLDRDLLLFLVVESGLAWASAGGRVVQVAPTFSRSNGRGLDFPAHRTEWGFGLRVHL